MVTQHPPNRLVALTEEQTPRPEGTVSIALDPLCPLHPPFQVSDQPGFPLTHHSTLPFHSLHHEDFATGHHLLSLPLGHGTQVEHSHTAPYRHRGQRPHFPAPPSRKQELNLTRGHPPTHFSLVHHSCQVLVWGHWCCCQHEWGVSLFLPLILWGGSFSPPNKHSGGLRALGCGQGRFTTSWRCHRHG